MSSSETKQKKKKSTSSVDAESTTDEIAAPGIAEDRNSSSSSATSTSTTSSKAALHKGTSNAATSASASSLALSGQGSANNQGNNSAGAQSTAGNAATSGGGVGGQASTATSATAASSSASQAGGSDEFTASSAGAAGEKKSSIVVKVAMIGDSQIGKTSLMVKYVEGSFDEDYIQTLGVNFMEKSISLRGNEITFSLWDLGGQREFVSMLPLVCNEAVALLFMFDLSRKSTLASVKEWYRQARGFNKTAVPFLIGTKFDAFVNLPIDEQQHTTKQARKFAKAMHAPLIYCSTRESINVQKIFKIVLAKAFDLSCTIRKISNDGEPILEY